MNENNAIKCISKGTEICDRVELSDIEMKQYIKIAMNIKIINDIRNYILMFGLKDEKEKCTATSEDTIFLVKCYEACIDKIVSGNYQNFELEINQTNGKRILGEL